MAWIYKIEDDTGRELAALIMVHDKYLLPDGTEMFINACPAWCETCKDFVLAEKLEQPGKMEERPRDYFEQSTKLRAGDHVFPDGFMARVRQATLQDRLHAASQWRIALAVRRSPPRCLKCGGFEFVELPEDRVWVQHPADPHKRVRTVGGQTHVSMGWGNLYDTDGNRIPDQGTKQ